LEVFMKFGEESIGFILGPGVLGSPPEKYHTET